MQRYGITGIFNEREHGKTTYMVKHMVSEVNSAINYDEAYVNIHVGPKVKKDPETGRDIHYGHPKIHFINYAEMMELNIPTRNGIPRALLALDQIPNYFDARASNTKLNIQFSKFIRESRQHGVDIIYTTWMRSEVDKRLRPFTNLIISAYSTPGGFVYKPFERETGRTLPTLRIPWAMAKATWRYFDSTELINDPTIPK